MPTAKSFSISVPISGDSVEKVSALADVPKDSKALLVIAHGAGAGMRHIVMQTLVDALNAEKIATFRYQFPYMEKGGKRPDTPKIAVATVEAAVAYTLKKFPKLPLFAGGKSFGGRMTTTAASQGKLSDVKGILCFGFPLHQPKKPSLDRAEHLANVDIPMLWLQGTRDDLADLKWVRQVMKQRKNIELAIIEGGDHSYHVLKSSGRKPDEVFKEIAVACRRFCKAHA